MELPACPVKTTLMLIGDKWKVLILRDLMDGTKHFGELKKSIGHVTQKVLTAQLRDMEDKGLLTRKVYAEMPPRVEYTLTETGHSLKPILHGGLGHRLPAAECRARGSTWALTLRSMRLHSRFLSNQCTATYSKEQKQHLREPQVLFLSFFDC